MKDRHKPAHDSKAGSPEDSVTLRLPPVITARMSGRDKDGDLVAEPLEWDRNAQGEPPRIGVLPAGLRRNGPSPRLGDVVLLRLHRVSRDGGSYVGRILKKIGRASERAIGVVRKDRRDLNHITAVDKRQAGRSWGVRNSDLNGATDGDLVAFETTTPARAQRPMARVEEVLDRLDGATAMSLIAIAEHGLPYRFSPEALAEADAARMVPAPREDWRALALITIDPADARDHDDAVHAAADPDPANNGGFIVTVAIADVAAYVRTGSALDEEARQRGNSVYFPDQVVPMLPERLSNDLCSLRPDVDRPALAMRMVFDRDGKKRTQSLHRILMRSAGKLSYQQAQAAINGETDGVTRRLRDAVLEPLWAAWRTLMRARNDRAPLDLELGERKLILDHEGKLEKVITPSRLDAHRLIEEMMIMANVAAAELLELKRRSPIYRVHDQPSLDRLAALRDFLSSLDIPLAKGNVIRPALFNRVLDKVRGGEHAQLVNEAILRSQAQAEYSTRNIGHFGLNLPKYAHFTSPIRRYADLMVHRALIAAYDLGADQGSDQPVSELDAIAAQTSLSERRAANAERQTADRIIAASLAGQIGEVFKARISGLTRAGLFVTLDETGADGLVPMSLLGRDHFQVDERRRRISGRRSGLSWRQGDEVEVRLVEAEPVAGALRFEILPGAHDKPRRGTRSPAVSQAGRDKGRGRRKRNAITHHEKTNG